MGEKQEGIASFGRNINKCVLNREETAYNFPAASKEALSSVSLFVVQICNAFRKLISWEQFKVTQQK